MFNKYRIYLRLPGQKLIQIMNVWCFFDDLIVPDVTVSFTGQIQLQLKYETSIFDILICLEIYHFRVVIKVGSNYATGTVHHFLY